MGCGRVAGSVLAALAVLGCASQPYPAPAPRSAPGLKVRGAGAVDTGDAERIWELEKQCRVHLSGRSTATSLAALDRVRAVLGQGCELTTVDRDPLHWLLRCRSDALFESGSYIVAATRKRACKELGGAAAAPWECVGGVLSGLLGESSGGGLANLDMAVLGHVDMQPLKPSSDKHLCTDLQKSLAYTPAVAWKAVSEDPEAEEQLYANNQLAWCRAASVASTIQSGMARASKGGNAKGKSVATEVLELAVLGMGTSWLQSRPEGVCPETGKAYADEPRCADARRVDILIKFTPGETSEQSSCDMPGDSGDTALYCLQQCREQVAVGQQLDGSDGTPAAPLFSLAQGRSAALPVGWYLKHQAVRGDRELNMSRLCQTLDISPTYCGLP